jgi:sarcosine oxidase subunit beta
VIPDKAIVCACEDVTVADLHEAVARGFGDIESMKRYTGLGTGPCQGKSCLAAAVRYCADRAHLPPEAQVPFRSRPPLVPTTVSAFAGLPDRIVRQRESPLVPPAARTGPHPLQPRERLPERASVVIVGGGIMGLALAWNLASRGETDVLVLERGYLCEGASGRNGGGVRAQWATPTLIELAKESIDFMARFAQELGINVWLRRGGYLFLADDEKTLHRLEDGARLHKELGLSTRIIDVGEACGIVPELDGSRFIAASWNAEDGVVFPWPFLWGYADGARKLGARIETFTRVLGLETEGGAVRSVQTDRGTVRTDRVVIACGAWSPSVATMAGVTLPNIPYRHEIVSSEPLKPFLGPLVSLLGSGLYFSQSMRGEIVGGMASTRPPRCASSPAIRAPSPR